jgi:hypothetical protein
MFVQQVSVEVYMSPIGPMAQIHTKAKADPRKIIADFFKPQSGKSFFGVFRPCSSEAMAKLICGQGIGRSVNAKGRIAKDGKLAGFVS